MDYVDYIDRSDQHALDDDGDAWLHRRKAVPWSPSDGDEEEKACIDSTVPASEFEFSRVYAVHDHAKVPVDKALHKGSPSEAFVKNPYILKQAVKSSVRLRLSFLQGNPIFGSGFYITPSLVASAGHVVRDRPKKGVLCDLLSHRGKLAWPSSFQTASCSSGVIVEKDFSFAKPSKNLYSAGSDCAFLRVSETSPKFLLPCSSSFLTPNKQKDCAVLSFPAVTEYLQAAEYELKGSNDSKIWTAHLPAMRQKLSEVAKAMKKDDQHPQVVERGKLALLDMLSSTFGAFSTGQLLCSVGVLFADNGWSISTSCSTLPGSSGGALCPIEHSDHDNFIGIHIGSFPGAPTNIATSCDNPFFVSHYFAKALPDLPKLDEIQSNGIEGFVHWLRLHSPTFNPVSIREVEELEKGKRHQKKRCLSICRCL